MNELRDNSETGELIQYIIIKIDDEQHRVSLSIKALLGGDAVNESEVEKEAEQADESAQ